MRRASATLLLLTLFAQGCAATPPPKAVSLDSFYKVDYRSWNCQQLADEADLLKDALPVATDHEPDAKRIQYIRNSRDAVRAAAKARNCKGWRAL